MAVLAGVFNALAYVRIFSSKAWVGNDTADWSWTHASIFVALAGCAGLLVAAVLLRTVGSALRRGAWSRALTIWLGFVAGGALSGASLVVAGALAALTDPTAGVDFVATGAFMAATGVLGGLLGGAEGALLAWPLAGLLGSLGGSPPIDTGED